MGLEIQDNELDQQIFQGSQITSKYHTDRANQIQWLNKNFVDLGLPSGTLWARHNIGATCRKKPNSWYGWYYAWGETSFKDSYRWDNYSHTDEDMCKTKYNTKKVMYDDVVDNKIHLDLEDDVASVTYGLPFSMPTVNDVKELCTLDNEWVEDYNGIKGLNGCVFTGTNGKTLFIPASGCRYDSNGWAISDHTSEYSVIWTNTLNPNQTDYAFCLHCDKKITHPASQGYRCNGRPVRAVIHR